MCMGQRGGGGSRGGSNGQSGGFQYDATTSHDLHLLVASKPKSAVQVEFSAKLGQHVQGFTFSRVLLPFSL